MRRFDIFRVDEKRVGFVNFFDPLQENRTLSVMPTFQCTAECMHCGTLSSPRDRTRLSTEYILEVIDQAADNGYKAVVLTGGEPTLAGKTLLLAIERAALHRLPVRLVTNAYWAVNDTAADQRVNDFVRVGLSEINYSTGDQHTRFVPLERVIRATRAAVKAGVSVAIMVETLKERRITKDIVETHPDFISIRQDFPHIGIKVCESPWMPLPASAVNKYSEGITVNRVNLSMRKPCDSVLLTTTIQADGSIGACCGLGMRMIPELQLGNVRETKLADADRMAANDFLKWWIQVEGPERILAWASTHNRDIKWENIYAHRCQACIRLYTDPAVRNVIAEYHQEKIADVIFSKWLLYHYNAGTTQTSVALCSAATIGCPARARWMAR